MTTLRQIRDLVAPLLARHADLALVRQMVVLRPIHHILRGILIDRTGEAARCQPVWFLMRLFARRDDLSFTIGDRMRHPEGLWLWSDPGLPETLIEVTERDALPRLRAVTSVGDYVATAGPPVHPTARALYGAGHVLNLLAVGDLDAACDFLASEEEAAAFWVPRLHELGLDEKLPRMRSRLERADRARLAGLLHTWEAYTVDKLRLRDIWEPTPFPLEAG